MNIFSSVTDNILDALINDERTMNADIEVINEQGIITLTGEVDTFEIAEAAEEVAGRQDGVLKIVNDLRVSQPIN